MRAWMMFKGYSLPPFLKDAALSADQRAVRPAEDSPGRPSRRRPRKRVWVRIEELIREMYATKPETPHMTLAIDACNRVAAEFPSEELPAWEAVLPHMKSILAKSSRH